MPYSWNYLLYHLHFLSNSYNINFAFFSIPLECPIAVVVSAFVHYHLSLFPLAWDAPSAEGWSSSLIHLDLYVK
jgi:hypothetical protein